MKLRSIEKEAAACRKAFAKSKVGDLAWCVHHQVLIEPLTEPAEERIEYILSSKAKNQRARRLREMRPVKGTLPDRFQKAYADRQKADADRQKADADRQKADADRHKADADCQKAYADWQNAVADCQKAYADCQKAGADRQKAYADWQKAGADRQKAVADRHKADADCQKAYADWQKADADRQKADADPAIIALHAKECPDSAWNGKTIFPEES